jgi:hypothetical protein
MRFAKYVTRVETMYCVTDRLHSGRTVRVPGPEIAPTVSAWLAELGAHSPLVEDLARAACGVRRQLGGRPTPSATGYPLMCSLRARRSSSSGYAESCPRRAWHKVLLDWGRHALVRPM